MTDRLFVITGASRGIGKAMTSALAYSKHFTSEGAHFVLTSTNQNDLDAAKTTLEQNFTSAHGNTEKLKVHTHPIDFSDMAQIEAQLETLFGLASKDSKWKQIVLVMNHGSLGELECMDQVSSNLHQVQTTLNVNITSCIMFASMALKKFAGKADRIDLVNISSLAAVKPFESWGLYCIGKAARDMLIQVIAVEADTVAAVSKGSIIRALNYAPGPVDTDMQKKIRTTAPIAEQQQLYTTLFETGKLVTAEATTTKLVGILELGEYQSGAHIDFYDDV